VAELLKRETLDREDLERLLNIKQPEPVHEEAPTQA
jgi:hypothetical protein